MPSRHSKNATATTHFTYHERSTAGHGTLKRRFGKDSQLPFGFCCLCLASTFDKSPLASPSGFVFCKECIYANLLAQKRAIQENLVEYEKFLDQKQQKQQQQAIDQERKQLQQLLEGHKGGIVAASVSSSSSSGQAQAQAQGMASSSKDNVEDASEREQIQQKLTEKVDSTSEEAKRQAMQQTSFWIPDCTPSAEQKVNKPDTHTKDPMSLEPMKLKHLMPIKFEWSSTCTKTSSATKDRQEHQVLCAVTKKSITHHQAVLIRPSGLVILQECLQDMVLPTMTCPVTGLKLRKKDLVLLQRGGTGFSAHSTVEAKKYRPTMT